MSDRSSTRDVAPALSDHCVFLDPGTLLFQHCGPRALLLGDLPIPSSSASSLSRSRDHMRSTDLSARPRHQVARVSSPVGSQGSSYSSNPGSRRFTPQPDSRLGRGVRRQDRSSAAVKYNFTPEETRVYEAFIRLLANFEPDDMFDIISDVIKDAKTQFSAQ